MPEAEFDKFADDYAIQHAQSIKFSGEDPTFFSAYKVKVVYEEAPACSGDHRILDFGGGTGNSIAHFRRYFPDSKIDLADPSSRSLEIAMERFPSECSFCQLVGNSLPYKDATFDIVFVACVFHHVPATLHLELLSELRRVLRPRGSLFVFEHNPYNPLTRKAVNDCAFDIDAVLLSARQLRSNLSRAGFRQTRTRYRIFFPRLLRSLRPLEPWLGRIPLGGQYYAHARV